MVPTALLPISNSVRFQALDQQEDHFVLQLKTKSTHSRCPICGNKSNKRHSSYKRKLRDLPWAGIPVKVNLWVNKYYCKHEGCDRKVFTERFDDHLKPYARRTARLTKHLNQIGCALGGNPGAKLAHFIGIPVSSSTILRILHNIEPEEIATPRVLGIDDWAFRKGCSYGTILVDLEKRKPIDLLPDREMETVKKWLETRPGIEIVSRDRASCYSKAAKLGAPQAIQVADRWHLLKNLGDALKRMLDKHNQELRLAAKDIAQAQRDEEQARKSTVEKIDSNDEPVADNSPPPEEKQSLAKYELNFLEVKRLKSEGHSSRSIHRQTGIQRETIKRYLNYEEYPQKEILASKISLALPFGLIAKNLKI